MRTSFVSVLEKSGWAVEDWLLCPPGGSRPFELSRKGIIVCARPDCEKCPNRKDVCPRPVCVDCKRRVLKIVRGVTQLACRFVVWSDSECMWLIRATRNSDEVRNPRPKRESVRATARRMVRGCPVALKSVDCCPVPKCRPRKVNLVVSPAKCAKLRSCCSPTFRPTLAKRSGRNRPTRPRRR